MSVNDIKATRDSDSWGKSSSTKNCEGNFFQGTACHRCAKCQKNKRDIVAKIFPYQNPDNEFDRWIANKPSYYTEEMRQAFLAGWRSSRGEL